jgi:hypothetical protein
MKKRRQIFLKGWCTMRAIEPGAWMNSISAAIRASADYGIYGQ